MTVDLLKSIAENMTAQNTALHGALKTQPDLDRYVAIIHQTRPDLIVECGTLHGVSALWFADRAQCPVITIDVMPNIHANVVNAWGGRVTLIYGSSTEPELIGKVGEIASQHRRVMVVLDSDHTAEHVYDEMVGYGPMVSPGMHMVVEDTLVRWMPWYGMGDGPLGAVEKFMAEHGDGWELDEKIESMSSSTQHPGGWLRKAER